MSLPDNVQRWLDDPKSLVGDGEKIASHDKSCSSLAYMWLPRRGGYTAFEDVMTCFDCDLIFYWEGIFITEESDGSEAFLCNCCLRGRNG